MGEKKNIQSSIDQHVFMVVNFHRNLYLEFSFRLQ